MEERLSVVRGGCDYVRREQLLQILHVVIVLYCCSSKTKDRGQADRGGAIRYIIDFVWHHQSQHVWVCVHALGVSGDNCVA